MDTVFVLGPIISHVTEPDPSLPGPTLPGRRGIQFNDPAVVPGGTARFRLKPAALPDDVPPINVYVFYFSPAGSLPADATPDTLFTSAATRASVSTAHAPEEFEVQVPGVVPGVYTVATVLEYRAASRPS